MGPAAVGPGVGSAGASSGELRGKVAVVTGAGRGLGRAAARSLAAASAHVALLGRTAKDLDAAAREVRAAGVEALALPTDVSLEADVERAAQAVQARFGQVDILVNNAGVAQVQPLLELRLEDLTRLIGTNVIGAMLCAKAFGAHMVRRGQGRIINIGSIAGLVGEPGLSAYAASKGALLSFTRALSAEWARHGVTVNALAPGYFRTDLNAAAMDDPQIGPRLLRQIPLRRFGQPDELGPLLVYLASDASAFMTGATLVIDGGQAAR